jgi:DNA-directed RNA polymerase subunit omega
MAVEGKSEGIANPPVDDLLDKVSSPYALAITAAKRARQIDTYYSQLGEGVLEYIGPLVETAPQEKPLSVALREIHAGLLTADTGEDETGEEQSEAGHKPATGAAGALVASDTALAVSA